MNTKVPGIHVPDEIIDELASVLKEERVKKSLEISARLIKRLRWMFFYWRKGQRN